MKYTLITLKLLNFYFALAISIEYDVLVKEEDAEIQERVIHTNARAHQLIQDQPVIQTERVCVCVREKEREEGVGHSHQRKQGRPVMRRDECV